MAVAQDEDLSGTIRYIKANIAATVKSDKLLTQVVKRSLNPILDAIDQIYRQILTEVGQKAVEELKERASGKRKSGRTYIIIQFNPDEEPGSGQRWVKIGEHTASRPGSAPNEYTGALEDSITFDITKRGILRVGQVDLAPGGYSKGRQELRTVWYKAGKIFVTDDEDTGERTPVGEYAKYLEEGRGGFTQKGGNEVGPMEPRPWISAELRKLRFWIKRYIKERLHAEIKRRTRSESVRKAFTFRIYLARIER